MAIFQGMDFTEMTDHDLRDRIMTALNNLDFWEAEGNTESAAAYRKLAAEMRAEAKRRGLAVAGWTEPKPPRRLP